MKNLIELHRNDIVYLDMDGVLVEKEDLKEQWDENRLKQGFFLAKSPLEGALDSFNLLSKNADVYILSTPVWDNPHSWIEKRLWVEQHLGNEAKKKLILTHNKSLNIGKLLVDDSVDHGVEKFRGIVLQFGSREYPNWKSILKSLSFKNG